MELKAMYCPNCGGAMDIDLTNREFVFCPYCGQQIHIEDGRVQITQRIINDADIIRAQGQKAVDENYAKLSRRQRHKLELERIKAQKEIEKARAEAEEAKNTSPMEWVVLIVTMIIAGIISIFVLMH